jgi:enterochelin esterase-like enzyme
MKSIRKSNSLIKMLVRASVLFIVTNVYSQTNFQQFLAEVELATTDAAKAAIIDTFMDHARSVGIPYIEGDTANFIYLADDNTTSVTLDLLNNPRSMARLSNTNFFHTSLTFGLDALLAYIFILDSDSLIIDPENPKVVTYYVKVGGPPNSELAMPLYVYPEEVIFDPSIPHGTVTSHDIYSVELDLTYQVWVYLPPDYDAKPEKRFPSLYLNDGQGAVDTSGGAMTIVIDNLIHHSKIEELIAVFISSYDNTRGETYGGESRFDYESFVINTLVSFIDSAYQTVRNPKLRGIFGASLGGLSSTQIAYNQPDVFGLCAVISPNYMPNDKIVYNTILNGPRKDIWFYLQWGTYEWGSYELEYIQSYATRLKNTLIANGYRTRWNELYGQHYVGSWRGHFDDFLEFFFSTTNWLTIFPGDTDNNGIVDALDILPIGLYFLNEGYGRDSTSYSWSTEGSINWSWDTPPATHADANGDGIVDEKDVIAIGMN